MIYECRNNFLFLDSDYKHTQRYTNIFHYYPQSAGSRSSIIINMHMVGYCDTVLLLAITSPMQGDHEFMSGQAKGQQMTFLRSSTSFAWTVRCMSSRRQDLERLHLRIDSSNLHAFSAILKLIYQFQGIAHLIMQIFFRSPVTYSSVTCIQTNRRFPNSY